MQARYDHYRGMTGHLDPKNAMELQKISTDISASLGDLQNDLFSKLAPSLEIFAKKFSAFLVKVTPQLEQLIERFGKWLASIDWNKVLASIEQFIAKIQAVVKEMGGWKKVAEILGGILALKVLAPIIGLVFNMGKLVPLLVAGTSGASGLALAFGALGVALAAAGGAYLGLKADGALDNMSQKASGNPDETFGDWLWERSHPFNPKTGKREFSLISTLFARASDVRANIDEQRNWQSPNITTPNVRMPRGMTKAAEGLAMQYLTRNGFSQGQAAGIVGNLMAESSMKAGAVGPDGKHFGLEQLGGSRIGLFNAYSKRMGWGTDIQHATELQQLQYLVHESQTTEKKHYDMLKKTVAVPNAAAVFGGMIERFGNDGSLGKRIRYAELANAAFPGARASNAAKPATKHTNTVSINTLNVNAPKATDAKGVAAGMKTALQQNPLIMGYVTALA